MRHVTKDIAELCAAAGIDSQGYQVFSTPPLPEAREEQAHSGEMRVPPPEAISPLAPALPSAYAARDRAAAEPRPQWQQLSQAFGTMRAVLSKATETEQVTVVSVAGGTGGSTVVATLARLLSTSERVAVIEAAEHPLLAYHFGVPQANAGACTMARERPGMRGAAHIFGTPLTAATARFEWAGEKAAGCVGAYRRVLVDAGSASGAESLADARSLVLLVAAPDTNAAVRLPNLISTLAARGARVKLLLNRFDETQRLHLAFLARLEEHFAETLLPVRIRFSHLVPEALAEGQTTVDFAPGSPVAEDFARLAAWLEARQPDGVAVGGSC